MMNPLSSRLLAFARKLQTARDFRDLLETTRTEVLEAVGYRHVWLFVADLNLDDEGQEARLSAPAGAQLHRVWGVAPAQDVEDDPMTPAIFQSDQPVIVDDARTDPRTDKAIVEKLGSRTLIHLPLRLLDKPFGAFGVGTFADEGCRPPTPAQREHLLAMATPLAVAVGRIRFIDEHARAAAEKQRLEHHLFQLQKFESLGLMAGGIAHDFNNLLMIILVNAKVGLVEAHNAPPGTRDAVIAAAEQGIAVTRQLMAMSREQPVDLKPLDLNAHLTQLLTMLQRLLPSNVEVALDRAATSSMVEADAAQIDQVFVNLCINARDAMPDGGRIELATSMTTFDAAFVARHLWARPGRYARTSVTDTGPGMPPEIRERIFEPFFSTRKNNGGSGLGLAVVHGIVSRHRGFVDCKSEVGLGTTFDVYLPLADGRSLASV